MKVVVTGGSGFIGSHVVDRLIDGGHDVVVVDQRPPHRSDATYRAVDIGDLDGLADAFAGAEVVFHLAGVADVNVAHADPVGTVEANVVGTARVCEACRRTSVRRVVLASTVWVYGAAVDTDGPVDEDIAFDLARAGHLYTASKLAAELVVRSYQQLYDLEFTVLRYGIPYGTRMRDSLVIPKFVQMALDGEPITLEGDGSQYRNYVHVTDLADAHLRALADGAVNEVFNLEGSEPVSIRALVDAIGEVLGRPPAIEHRPARSGDYAGREVSAEKAERVLGWRPRIAFADGLRRYTDWHTARQSGGAPPPPPARRWAGAPAAGLALACLLVLLLTAPTRSELHLAAGLAGSAAAVLAFWFWSARARSPGPLIAAGGTLAALWLLARTGPGLASGLVGLLLGAAIARLVHDRFPDGLPSRAAVVAVVAAPAGLVAVVAVGSGDLLWAAATLALGAAATRLLDLEPRHLPPLAGTLATILLAGGTVVAFGATSASASWFGPVVTHGPRNQPRVAITLHGYTDPVTLAHVRRSLNDDGAVATFFLPGSWVSHNRQASEALLDDGDLIADYSYGGSWRPLVDPSSRLITHSQTAFRTALDVCPAFLQPAAGRHSPLMARAAHHRGMALVTWDVLASRIGSPDQVSDRILSHTRPGSIIAFDLGTVTTPERRDPFLASLDATLAGLRQEGLSPVRLDALLGAEPYTTHC